MQQRDGPIFASAEVETFWRFISSSLDRLVGVLNGQPIEILNWRPPAPETNSIYGLAHHTLCNARVNLLGNLCRQHVERDRDSEFTVVAGASTPPDAGWIEIRRELVEALSTLTAESLDAEYAHHWRGAITGREILIIVARHSAEHLGQAELTRDLAHATLNRCNL